MDFEQITQMIQQLGESLGPKIQKWMETSAINGNVNNAKKELEQNYTSLGKRTYEKYAGKPLKGLETQFEAVKASLAIVEAMTSQM